MSVHTEIRIDGADLFQKRMNALVVSIDNGKAIKPGMTASMKVLAKQQAAMAPIRKGRTSRRRLKGLLQKKKLLNITSRDLAKTRFRTTRLRTMPKDKATGLRMLGPGRLIKPGQLMRSIGSRVRKHKGNWVAKAGMNVGVTKAKRDKRAPHAHLVGLGTKSRKTKAGKNRGVMPANKFIAMATQSAAPAALQALEAGVLANIHKEFRG